jgi:hypothetical protein
MKRRRRPRRGLEAPLTLDAVLREDTSKDFAVSKVVIAHGTWRDVVGAKVATHAQPESLSHGTLVICVKSSSWANELSFLTDVITNKLRLHGVEVRRIRFRVGEVTSFERPPERRVFRKVPAPIALPPQLEADLRRVEDDELSAVLRDAAAHSLAIEALSRGEETPRGAGTRSDPPAHNSRKPA